MMISMWSGLCLGVLVSAIGVRVLRFLFSPLSFTAVGDMQLGFFNVVDVFVTGGLIAGGSDQIHKIMKLIRVVLDNKTEEVEEKKINRE